MRQRRRCGSVARTTLCRCARSGLAADLAFCLRRIQNGRFRTCSSRTIDDLTKEQGGQSTHGQTGQPVKHLPGTLPGKPGRQPASAKSKQSKPEDAGRACPQDEPPAQVGGLLCADASRQEYRIEIDMGVEKRKRGSLSHGCRTAQAGTALCCLQLVRKARTAKCLNTVDSQEGGARQSQRRCKARAFGERLRHAHDACRDQHRVSHGAERDDASHMLLAQTLAQHEGVLRADGDDEAKTQGESLNKYREEHAWSAR